jgi:hypothetical protein
MRIASMLSRARLAMAPRAAAWGGSWVAWPLPAGLPPAGLRMPKPRKSITRATRKTTRKRRGAAPAAVPAVSAAIGRCVSAVTDRHNCGGCGSSYSKEKGSCICTEKETYINGSCEPCQDPRSICVVFGEERCVDLQTDRDNCGFCSNICPKSPTNRLRDFVCQGGQCVCTGTKCTNGLCCPAGYNVCVGNGAGCCPNDYHSCGNDRCCPDGFACGGNCGNECCAI